jgi:4-amino-4-deoxychorismate lyase
MTVEVTTLVNGEPFSTLSVHDRGFLYGDGLFETIAVYRGKPLLWDRHVARLLDGARRLGISLPSIADLDGDAKRLCAGVERAVLKIILTRGIGARGYLPASDSSTRIGMRLPWPDFPRDNARAGVSVRICETHLGHNPRLAGIKHLNRLEQVMARSEWSNGYAEGLMLDGDGNVIEGTMSNVFVVVDGGLITPDLRACGVEGVMRAVVLEAAANRGFRCQTRPLTLQDIDAAQELFITNSLIGVWPVRQVANREYPIGPITHKIQEAVRDAHGFERD